MSRRQLGTGLALFMDDKDPVSVHVLAAGGAEITGELARQLPGKKAFIHHALASNEGLTPAEYWRLKNQTWNAMKHVTRRDGKLRDDSELLERFDDEQNEHMLFIGWLDYGSIGLPLPVEVQIFQVWYFRRHPDKMNPDVDMTAEASLFPDMSQLPAPKAKALLRKAIQHFRQDQDVMAHPKTDTRSLMLGALAT